MQRHDAIISRILITEVKMIIYSGQSGSSYDNRISYAYIVDNDIDYHGYHAMDFSKVDCRYQSGDGKKSGDVMFQELIDKSTSPRASAPTSRGVGR